MKSDHLSQRGSPTPQNGVSDPCSLIWILDMGALLSPLKIQVFKVFELFSCGEKHPYKLQFKQSSLISGKGEVVGIMKMATW